MFTWICPKCGREVPPAYSECPNCNPQQPSAPASASDTAATVEIPKPAPVAPPPPAAALPRPSPAVDDIRAAAQAAQTNSFLNSPPPPPPESGSSLKSILITVGATLGVVVVLAGIYFLVGRKPASAESASAPSAAASGPAAGTTKSTHPLAKYLEITGLRVKEGKGGTMSLGFVIINHSAADMPELKMKIAVKSDKKDIYDFDFNTPPIPAFEAKDLSVPMKTNLKPYELPDWQFLKGEFEITSAP